MKILYCLCHWVIFIKLKKSLANMVYLKDILNNLKDITEERYYPRWCGHRHTSYLQRGPYNSRWSGLWVWFSNKPIDFSIELFSQFTWSEKAVGLYWRGKSETSFLDNGPHCVIPVIAKILLGFSNLRIGSTKSTFGENWVRVLAWR